MLTKGKHLSMHTCQWTVIWKSAKRAQSNLTEALCYIISFNWSNKQVFCWMVIEISGTPYMVMWGWIMPTVSISLSVDKALAQPGWTARFLSSLIKRGRQVTSKAVGIFHLPYGLGRKLLPILAAAAAMPGSYYHGCLNRWVQMTMPYCDRQDVCSPMHPKLHLPLPTSID